ncbi:MAG: hypothetical protein J3K34DRAFT_516546 [Monoraphidium minutum]|nr:MAG: hypothetical protein J3K34DRAFT_516546 [Monoraphidium minutum]
MGAKDKHKHKEGKKEKHRKKDKHKKRSGKEKERRRSSRRGSSSSSSSSGSDSDGAGRHGAALARLERERAAVRACRALLAAHPAARRDLRELLWSLDNGKAVGVGGVGDAALRGALEELLSNLGLKASKGQHFLPSGAPTTLSVVGFVFDEPIQAAPPPAAPAAAPTAAAPTAAAPAAAAPASAGGARQEAEEEDGRISSGGSSEDEGGGGIGGGGIGPAVPPGMREAAAAAVASEEEEEGQQQQQQQRAAAGPERPGGDGQQRQDEEGEEEGREDEGGGGDAAAAAGARRVVGPAMPAPELLAAAATYKAEVEAGAGWDAVNADGGESDDDDPLVGPPPPAFIEADAAAPADAREAEVVRVLRVLSAAAAGRGGGGAAPPGGAAAGGSAAADPYDVLGVQPAAAAGEVRKVYWRLSLLVHPDKCGHAGAAEAFQAVSQAAATLQDAAARKKESRLRRIALDVAAEHARRIQWAALRGEKLSPEVQAAAAAAAAAAAGPLARETWMTEVPPELQATAGPAAEGPRQFGIKPRGDTSGWTDTPEQAKLRAAGMLPPPPGAPLAIAAGPRLTGGEIAAPPGVAEAVREYNEKHRGKSLLEQHMDRQAAAGKEKRREGKEKEKSKEKEKGKGKDKGKKEKKDKGEKRPAAGPPEEDWVGKHPWRPFDRDKDLEIKMTPKAGAAMLKDAGGLSSRFSSGR